MLRTEKKLLLWIFLMLKNSDPVTKIIIRGSRRKTWVKAALMLRPAHVERAAIAADAGHHGPLGYVVLQQRPQDQCYKSATAFRNSPINPCTMYKQTFSLKPPADFKDYNSSSLFKKKLLIKKVYEDSFSLNCRASEIGWT